jgi:translation elongation factor EF-Tu-like GTPase
MKAKFEITDVFKLTGRGFVLSGNILEGSISAGDNITFDNKTRTIKGVEMFYKPTPIGQTGKQSNLVGLIISKEKTSMNEDTKEELLKSKGQIGIISK